MDGLRRRSYTYGRFSSRPTGTGTCGCRPNGGHGASSTPRKAGLVRVAKGRPLACRPVCRPDVAVDAPVALAPRPRRGGERPDATARPEDQKVPVGPTPQARRHRNVDSVFCEGKPASARCVPGRASPHNDKSFLIWHQSWAPRGGR